MNINNLDYELNYVTVSNYVRNLCYSDKDELKNRIYNLLDKSQNMMGFRDRDFFIFSCPGRTELSGNHTDHNHGKVLAGSIHLDSFAIASRRNDNKVRIYSENTKELIDLDYDYETFEVVENEFGTSKSLIRGISKYLRDLGCKLGGFDAYIESRVLMGSGLSSSASFEVLMAKVISYLFGMESIDPVTLSIISQKAENIFFGKPCGLMDQIACGYGGIVSIDFQNNEKPIIDHVNVNFSKEGFLLCLVDTKGDHKDLTDDYTSITNEMKALSNYFDKSFLREVSWTDIKSNVGDIRNKVNDRAILRAYHFYKDSDRVDKLIKALQHGKIMDYLSLINDSGKSSSMYLQNLYSPSKPQNQELLLGVLLTQEYLESKNVTGGCRVHGGGFAGTIQSYIPHSVFEDYKNFMENIFGKDSVLKINIRPTGVVKLF